MTVLYRATGVERPDLGRLTFWTTDPESAEWLATWAGESLPSRVYRTREIIVDPVEALDVSPFVRDGRIDANDLLTSAERRVHPGCRWVQFEDHGRLWKGAMLYLGDEPVPASPAPREN